MGREAAAGKRNRAARAKQAAACIAARSAPAQFHNLAVFDARGARRLARAAIQATVDVRDECLAQFEPPLIHQLDLANPPARRIGFLTPQPVRRAIVQAKPAVNAARVIRVFRLVSGAESAERERKLALRVIVREWHRDRRGTRLRCIREPSFQMPPTNRPGLKTP